MALNLDTNMNYELGMIKKKKVCCLWQGTVPAAVSK
jgi:hypothetical protein